MTQGWPAGAHHVAYDKLPDVLWDGSSHHARLVYEFYPGEAAWDAQRVAISIYEVHRNHPLFEYSDAGEYGYEPAGTAYVEREGSADRFECGVCRLKLDRRDYLVEAAVPLEVELEADDATEEEISDYAEAQVDSHIQFMIDQRRGK